MRPPGLSNELETLKAQLHSKNEEIRQLQSTLLDFEEQLKEAQERALDADLVKSQFLANISHEIRTPMNGIIGMAKLVQRTDLDAMQTEHIHDLVLSAEDLLAILDDILDYSKIESGDINFNPVSFHLAREIKMAVEKTRPRAEKKGLRLNVHIDPEAPEAIFSDPQRLTQVLWNLVSNAIKFTQEGEVNVGVYSLESSQGRVKLRFSVQDTGSGIPAERLDSIFELFNQVDNSSNRIKGGTGLGLAICRHLSKLMGGRIEVKSTPDKGSTFSLIAEFEIAKLESRTPPAVGIPLSKPRHQLVQASKKLSILLAEDNHINRIYAKTVLEQAGHTVLTAVNGEEAVRVFTQDQPEFILMDVQMPKMDGIEATRRIRGLEEKGQRVPIVALTAHAMAADQRKCEAAGMDGYLTKPIDPQSLIKAIDRKASNHDPLAGKSEGDTSASLHALPESGEAEVPRATQGLDEASVVLIVDDELTSQKLTRRLVEKQGHKTLCASNGRQAIEVLEKEAVDVILMDVVMPEMDGLEACRRIKAKEATRQIPILLVTSLDQAEDRLAGIEAGADDFLTKPLHGKETLVRIRNAARLKKLFDQQAENYQTLQRLEEMRDSLSQMLVHDLRSPLTGISGYAQLLLMTAADRLEENQLDYVRQINFSSKILNEMISAILDVNRLETDDLPLNLSVCQLEEVLASEVSIFAGLPEINIKLESHGCPEVECDLSLIKRVVNNLLANAIKYTENGECIRLKVSQERDFAKIEVIDLGPGVPDDFRDKIFEKFVQVEKDGQRKPYSSGLGLTFCKLVIDKHQGTIGVSNGESRGSVFWFKIPIRQSQSLVA